MEMDEETKREVQKLIREERTITIREQTKIAIRNLIKEELDKTVKREIKIEVGDFVQSIAKETILLELRNISVPEVLTKRFDSLLQQKFTPIIKNAVDISARKVAGKVNKQIRQVINLKTSTIMEIQKEVRKIPAETEKETLNLLQQDFPEYYKQISQKSVKNVLLE